MTDDVVLNKAAVIERCVRRVREEHGGDDARLDVGAPVQQQAQPGRGQGPQGAQFHGAHGDGAAGRRRVAGVGG